jgi:hypothetical protein
MSTSISSAVAIEEQHGKRELTNKYLLIKPQTFALAGLPLFVCVHILYRVSAGLVVIQLSSIKIPNQEKTQHQFLKLWLTRLCMSSLLQALRTFVLDQHSKPITLSLSSSQATSTWCKLPHLVERHMKILVLIFRISWRLVA